jgi:hypothetical protein
MFVPVIAGSDKTTVSVATGHQEYHPVYMSPGNLSNVARRAHGNAVLPVAFLPIPKSECSNTFLHLLNLILNIPPMQQVSDSGRCQSIKSFVGNFIMLAYQGFFFLLRPE